MTAPVVMVEERKSTIPKRVSIVLAFVVVFTLVFFLVPIVPVDQYCYSGWVPLSQYFGALAHGTPTRVDFGIPFLSYGVC